MKYKRDLAKAWDTNGLELYVPKGRSIISRDMTNRRRYAGQTGLVADYSALG